MTNATATSQDSHPPVALLTCGADSRMREVTSRMATFLPLVVAHCESLEEMLTSLSQRRVACVLASQATGCSQDLDSLVPLFANRCGAPVILTKHDPPTSWVVDAVRRGACSVLDEPVDEESLRKTLIAAIEQARFAGRDREVVEEYHRRLEQLSEGERKVLDAICDGQLNKQIAKKLNVSVRTVEQRRQRVFRKMDVPSAVPLACHITTARTLERIHRNGRIG